MSTQHTVAAGDHMTGIAEKYGFKDFRTIWDHPANQPLKAKRPDPHVLNPGDVVTIPDKVQRQEVRASDKSHRFRVISKPLKLRLALKDFHNLPIAGVACKLTVAGQVHQLVSDGDGIVEAAVPKTATEGVLEVPELDIEYPVRIGHLDPLDEESGWQARLVNLGYYGGEVGDNDLEQLRYAIEEFQCDHGLKVTGELDGATRAKLKSEHGY